MFRHCFLVFSLNLLAAFPLPAQECIRFARTPDISPDGKLVAFSYLGDIWIVNADGGVARHLTMHEKHDMIPIFSPDGSQIAFSSNRHGSYDVFVIPTRGGKPTRLTFDSAEDYVTGWSPDSQSILFSSGRTVDFPFRYELFTIPATGGRAKKVTAHEGREGTFSPKGDLLAYVRGPGTWYRKGYRGSSNDDIWLANADGTNHRQISTFHGQDNSPMFSPDGKTLYFVSEHHGTPANIVGLELTGEKAQPRQLTFHKEDAVRRARISRNGQSIVYECGADLYQLNLANGQTQPLAIEVYADEKTNTEKQSTFSSNATEFALTPDEKHVAFVVHGEIFLMPRTGGKAKRLTNSPAYDHGLAWSPDAKKLLFLSDRLGHEDIFLLESDDADHPQLLEAHRFKSRPLTTSPEAELGVSFSPDGKRVAFLQAGRLLTMNPDGTDQKTIVPEGTVIDYEWSPDGRWICYSRQDGSFASELFIIPSSGATPQEPARNITRFATFNSGVTWSKTGNRLAFISQRKRNSPSAFVLALHRPVAPGAPASKDFDWEDIHLRVKQPTTMNISECAISNDGTRIAFRATNPGGDGEDLYVAAVDGSQVSRITTGNLKPRQIQWSRLFSTQLYFRDGSGNIRTATASGVTPGNAPPHAVIPFLAKMTIRQQETFQEMFDQSWRALNNHFYDKNFHGADWNKVREKYRPLVQHCALKEDLYALISLMIGELNASHLGITGAIGAADQSTADLGLIFDPGYNGPGLKIAEIVKRGPADQRGIKLQAGDIVLKIDDLELSEKLDLAVALNDKSGETVVLTVTSDPDNPKARRRLEIKGTSRTLVAGLMYDRWVRNNAALVSKMSKGAFGYIHIPNMREQGLEVFERALYSDNFDKEAIVLDIRYNGGGFIHEKILNYLGGKEHTIFHQRDGGSGLVLRSDDRKWTRPLVLVMNNRSFSDAEIFPHAFRTLGLGKLVGQATGGHVIGTREIQLIDGSSFRTPRIGVMTHKGVNMDKEGVQPDYFVEIHPEQFLRGEDPQLQKAVEVLEQEVTAWKKSRPAATGGE